MAVWTLHRASGREPKSSTAGQKHVSSQVTAHYEAAFHSVRAVKDKSGRTSRMSCRGLWLLVLMDSQSFCGAAHIKRATIQGDDGTGAYLTPGNLVDWIWQLHLNDCVFSPISQPGCRVVFSVCCWNNKVALGWKRSCTNTPFPRLLQETTGRFRDADDNFPPSVQRMSVLTYLTLLKTMSTSVRVMLLPSITPQSLQSLDQFLPCISLPVARVSPWMAKRRKASSSAVSSTGVEEPIPPSLVPLESDESLLDARSLDWSLCGRKGTWLMLECLAVWTRKSSALCLEKIA